MLIYILLISGDNHLSREARHHLSHCYFIRGAWPLMKTWLQSAVEFLMCGRVAFSKHERNWARALRHPRKQRRTPPSGFSCRREAGAHASERDPRARARFLSRPPLLEPRSSVRAPAQRQGFREPGEQTSDSGGERKMEVRVGERLLCLAVLCSVLCVDSVFGKYVKGTVNTKEVRVVVSFTYLISFHLRQWHRHKLTGVRIGLDCVSARRCLRVGLFRDRRGGSDQFTVKLPGIFTWLLNAAIWPTHSPLFCLAVARHLRACQLWRIFYPHYHGLWHDRCPSKRHPTSPLQPVEPPAVITCL